MKNTTLKRLLAVVLTGVLLVSLFAGCNSSEPTDSGTPAGDGGTETPADDGSEEVADDSGDSGDGTKIRIAWWGNQLRNDTTMAMLDAYTAANPSITFEAEFTDWSGYWDKLATQAASNNLPDIIQQDHAYIAQYQAKNQLASLTEQIEAGNLNVDDVSESILDAGTFDGTLYALVSGVNAVCIFYDVDVLEESGVTVPDRPTYQDIMDISAAVYEATGVRGNVPAGNGSLAMIARGKGEVLFDVENKCFGTTEETMLEMFTYVKQAIDSEWSLSVDVLQEASTAGLEAAPLPTGKSWIDIPGGSNMLAAHQAAAEHSLSLAMYPRSESATEENMYLRPAMFWSITSSSQNKEEAAKLIDYYTNAEEAQDLLQAERGVPISSKMADYLQPQLDDVNQLIFNYIAEVTEIATPVDPPQPVGANEVNRLIDDLTDLLRYGEISPEDAAARLFSEGNDILAKAEEE